jgi:hypothetical protein
LHRGRFARQNLPVGACKKLTSSMVVTYNTQSKLLGLFNTMFSVKDIVRYKLALDLEQLEAQFEVVEDGSQPQPAPSQSSQASAATQAVGWRFKGSRAVVTGVDTIQEIIEDTLYTIQMQV